MDLQTVIDSTPALKKPRRNHTDEFKLQLIQQAQQPGASVAKVAMQYQVNANLLHKWIRQNKSDTPQSEQQTDFLTVFLQTTPIKEETLSPTIPARKVPVRIKINAHSVDAFGKAVARCWYDSSNKCIEIEIYDISSKFYFYNQQLIGISYSELKDILKKKGIDYCFDEEGLGINIFNDTMRFYISKIDEYGELAKVEAVWIKIP